jgi:soluble lytic murein transglycosylase-like protein
MPILLWIVAGLAGAAVIARNVVDWRPPASAAPYLEALRIAEERYALPKNLLARMAYQESRFRPEIIDGRVKSSAGAVGIMQIVPRWHPAVNATDPFASISYAGRYMRDLYNRFHSWELALAAYNAGPSIVQQLNGIPPYAETQAYVREISADVALA